MDYKQYGMRAFMCRGFNHYWTVGRKMSLAELECCRAHRPVTWLWAIRGDYVVSLV